MSAEETKQKILGLTRQYYKEQFGTKKEFEEGDRINMQEEFLMKKNL